MSATDYTSFGMALVGRTYSSGNYRYGFNGQEHSDDVTEGNYTAEFWEYDSRIGRRWNVDPLSLTWQSPYSAFNNNPILLIDPKGLEANDYQYHKAEKNDTYSSLSKRFNVTIDDLRKWNGYADNKIPVGQTLIVGIAKASQSSAVGGKGHEKKDDGIVHTVTSTAEKVFDVYQNVSKTFEKYPNAVEIINDFVVDPAAKTATQFTLFDRSIMTWYDLFNIWFFELKPPRMTGPSEISFSETDITTISLRNQEGVNQARDLALARVNIGNTNPVSHGWEFGVPAAKNALATGNLVTAFLGSFITTVTTSVNPVSKMISLRFHVMNVSGWESATRFRTDNDHNGMNDGIFPDKARGVGLRLGGNLTENWTWDEFYPGWLNR